MLQHRMDFIYGLWKAASSRQSEKGSSCLFQCLVYYLWLNSRLTFGLVMLQVGHAGTLDPMATGLLIVCVGKATKLADR